MPPSSSSSSSTTTTAVPYRRNSNSYIGNPSVSGLSSSSSAAAAASAAAAREHSSLADRASTFGLRGALDATIDRATDERLKKQAPSSASLSSSSDSSWQQQQQQQQMQMQMRADGKGKARSMYDADRDSDDEDGACKAEDKKRANGSSGNNNSVSSNNATRSAGEEKQQHSQQQQQRDVAEAKGASSSSSQGREHGRQYQSSSSQSSQQQQGRANLTQSQGSDAGRDTFTESGSGSGGGFGGGGGGDGRRSQGAGFAAPTREVLSSSSSSRGGGGGYSASSSSGLPRNYERDDDYYSGRSDDLYNNGSAIANSRPLTPPTQADPKSISDRGGGGGDAKGGGAGGRESGSGGGGGSGSGLVIGGPASPAPRVPKGPGLVQKLVPIPRVFDVFMPILKGVEMKKCYVVRTSSGMVSKSHTFTLYLEPPGNGPPGGGDPDSFSAAETDKRFLVQAKKKLGSKTSHYVITGRRTSGSNKGEDYYCGKVRGDWTGGSYSIFDGGVNPAKGEGRDGAPVRRELGVIFYEYDRMGPGRMKVVVPAVDDNNDPFVWPSTENDKEAILGTLKDKIIDKIDSDELPPEVKGKLAVCINKRPKWDNEQKGHVLNFKGRVTESSVKNFQLACWAGSGETTMLQFGRVKKNVFTLDFGYPLNAAQAFAICLSSMDAKLADSKGYDMIKKYAS